MSRIGFHYVSGCLWTSRDIQKLQSYLNEGEGPGILLDITCLSFDKKELYAHLYAMICKHGGIQEGPHDLTNNLHVVLDNEGMLQCIEWIQLENEYKDGMSIVLETRSYHNQRDLKETKPCIIGAYCVDDQIETKTTVEAYGKNVIMRSTQCFKLGIQHKWMDF